MYVYANRGRFPGTHSWSHGFSMRPRKSAVRNWHEPNRVKAVHQFVGFVGYYRRFVNIFAELAEPLVSLTWKGAPFVWTDQQQTAFDALKACLLSAPILGFPTEEGRFVLDNDASLFAVGGVIHTYNYAGHFRWPRRSFSMAAPVIFDGRAGHFRWPRRSFSMPAPVGFDGRAGRFRWPRR